MTREYQVSHDGDNWISVSGEAWASADFRHSRWRDVPDWTVVEELAKHVPCIGCEEMIGFQRATIARLERELAEAKESLSFIRAGNATLADCSADTARELGKARRELAEANRKLDAMANLSKQAFLVAFPAGGQ